THVGQADSTPPLRAITPVRLPEIVSQRRSVRFVPLSAPGGVERWQASPSWATTGHTDPSHRAERRGERRRPRYRDRLAAPGRHVRAGLSVVSIPGPGPRSLIGSGGV